MLRIKLQSNFKQSNALLNARGVLFHQLTYEETANREKTAEIIRAFQDGILGVLTAKRVLDEGVNIPQIERAFILASTTVETAVDPASRKAPSQMPRDGQDTQRNS